MSPTNVHRMSDRAANPRAQLSFVLTALFSLSLVSISFGLAITHASSANSIKQPVVAEETYTILHSFTGNDGHGFNGDTDGANPNAELFQAPDGNFYGTTVGGSATATGPTGTVFKVDSIGNTTVIHNFLMVNSGDGGNPYARLVMGKDGALYGTTYAGVGQTGGGTNGGVVFKITTAGAYTKLHTFTGAEGGYPKSGVIQAKDGNFYGASYQGGYNRGAIYKMTPNGTASLVYAFTARADSGGPLCDLVQASDGYFYGTTWRGGTTGFGTIFKVSASGNLVTLHTFTGTTGMDGANPLAGLTLASDGNFYGATRTGGQFGAGTVYRMDQSGNVTILHSFNGTDGADAQSRLIQANDGNLYGTTFSGPNTYGTVFKISLSGEFSVVHTFGLFRGDGIRPTAGVIQGLDGKLYGTTYFGGTQNKGTVFRLDVGLSPITTTGPGPSPTPRPSPGSTPGPTPTASPSPTPTPGPVCANNDCGRISGKGAINNGPQRFDFDVEVDSNARRANPRGHFDFLDRDGRVRFHGRDFTCLIITANSVTISGSGEVDRVPVTFQIQLTEGTDRHEFTFSIKLSDGFTRSGSTERGNLQIKRCPTDHAFRQGFTPAIPTQTFRDTVTFAALRSRIGAT